MDTRDTALPQRVTEISVGQQIEDRGWSWGSQYDHLRKEYQVWVMAGIKIYTCSGPNEEEALVQAYGAAQGSNPPDAVLVESQRRGRKLALELGIVDRRSFTDFGELERGLSPYERVWNWWRRLRRRS